MSASLWRIAPGPPTPLVVVGATPLLQTHGLAASLFRRVHAGGQLSVTEILHGPQPRLGYAEIPPPSGQKATDAGGAAFSDLDFALYLGHTTDADTLIERTATLHGYRAATTLPLGDTVLTLIGTETNPLAGGLSAALPWIAAILGAVLTAVAALTAENLVRRRGLAEVLAANTADLYARISGELDIVSVERLKGPLDDLVARTPTRLDLDLSGLAFMDSSGLALLLGVANRLGPLRGFGASLLIRRVIEATGLTGILQVQDAAP